MDLQTRKLNFIREFLSLSNEHLLIKLESLLKNEKYTTIQKPSVYDLLGVLSDAEADKMKKAIATSCEQIHEKDWQ